MGRIGKIARRTFLISSAAVASGVIFGYYTYKKVIPNPLLPELATGEAAITPYVMIDAKGVTLITPRTDSGQGTSSVQAHLLAEELDVDPHQVRLDPGRPSEAYYNTKVLEDSFPIPATNDSEVPRALRGSTEILARLIGLQITGGSSTVPDGFEKLRMAGAVARETLKEAASKQTGIARRELKTRDGAVVLPDGSKIPYAGLASIAATIAPVTDVELRPESEWRYIGKKLQRTDIVAKSTGTQNYGIDIRMEGMLYATVRANPGLGGKVKRYDAKAAEKMRGVKRIAPITNGVGVVADNTWRAFRAAAAIDIEWDAPEYPASSAEMWERLENSFTGAHRDGRFKNEGNVEAAFTAAGTLIEAEYRVPYLAHAPMEPLNAVVLYTGDRLDIWTGTQIPRLVQAHAAKLAKLRNDKVHVHAQMIGGSFGLRLEDTYALQAVELGMAMKGVPVKTTWSREEDMTHDYPRPMQISRARGTVRDGKVESYDLSIASQSVTCSWLGRLMMAPPGPDITIVAGAWDQPFAIPNYRVTGYRAKEMVPVSTWRSVGASGNGFLHAAFLDELIHAAGADPMSELIRLCNHDVSRKVLQALRDLSGWNGPRIDANRARGVAFTLSFGVPVAEVVEVNNTPQGIKIEKVYVVCDVGRIVDPVNFQSQLMGGVIWGLGHAMNCELTYENYAPQQTNYHAYEGMRLYQAPEIVVKGLQLGSQIRGIGEPAVPPAAPALANAIFAATGKRIRELPLNRQIRFV